MILGQTQSGLEGENGEGYRQNLVSRGGGVAAKWHLREMMVGGKVGPGWATVNLVSQFF